MPIDENLELATSSQFLRDNYSAFGGRSYYRSSSSSRRTRRRERAVSEARDPERSAEWASEERSSRVPTRDSHCSRSVRRRRVRSYSAASPRPRPFAFESGVLQGSLRVEQNYRISDAIF